MTPFDPGAITRGQHGRQDGNNMETGGNIQGICRMYWILQAVEKLNELRNSLLNSLNQ